MPDATQLLALAQIADAVVACNKVTGFPMMDVQIAIVIFESGWLTNAPGFNCCGTKVHSNVPFQLVSSQEWFTAKEATRFMIGNGRRTCALTNPLQTDINGRNCYAVQDLFCVFPSYAACLVDQVQYFLTGGLTGGDAWANYTQDGDKEKYVRGIASHYSTTASYAQQILDEAASGTVQTALKQAMERAGISFQ